MLPSSTVEPFRVTLVEPVAYLSDSYTRRPLEATQEVNIKTLASV